MLDSSLMFEENLEAFNDVLEQRQHRTTRGYRLCTSSACRFSVIITDVIKDDVYSP